jgi:dihydrofolate synthase/folylpolyglutamate synthase
LAVIRAAAGLAAAPLVVVTPEDAHRPPLDALELPLSGEHQRLNAALALATVHTLTPQLPVAPEEMVRGLATVRWAGRLQHLETSPGHLTLLDGAHNPAGVHMLEAALNQYFPGRRPVIIFGVLRDKDWSAMCHRLSPLAEAVYLVPVASARSATPDELRPACQITAAGAPVTTCASLDAALELTRHAPFRLITGSLYLIGEALEKLGATPTAAAAERALNEWLK